VYDAFKKLLSEVDLDGNRCISAAEADSVEVILTGFSWGGHYVIWIADQVSRTGWLKSPIHGLPLYRLNSPIKIKRIVVVDPVRTTRTSATIQSNVDEFVNYYQTKGGNAHFRQTTPPYNAAADGWGNFGNYISRKIRGGTYGSSGTQINVTTDRKWKYRQAPPDDNPNLVYRLYGKDANHDTMPWYAEDCIVPLLQ
jgi:hypothetical protein